MTTKPGLSMLAGLGSAAAKDAGTDPGDLPTNGDLPAFGDAATKDVGSGPTDVPTNADLPAHGTAAALDAGTGGGDLPTNDDITKSYLEAKLGAAGLLPVARGEIGNSGSASIIEGVGIASVNRTATGVVEVTLTAEMATSTYTVIAMQRANNGFTHVTARTTTVVTISTFQSGGTAADLPFFILVIGAKA